MTVTESVRDALEMGPEKVLSHLHPEGSFDVAEHEVPTGREEVWRFTPLKRLRGIHEDAPLDGHSFKVVVHPADVQDRDGAEPLLRQARRQFPFLERIIGDAGYQGPKMAAAVARTGPWELQIIRRCDQHRFVVLPKRWIVERTIGWISHHRS